ncbi:MAG: DUF748 domain-containing protein [Sutterellaceae bacterium]|nr:DUF748 domain-containing protein [Sutterellaceae bacterium]
MRIIKPVIGVAALVGIYAAAGYVGVPFGVRWAVNNYLPEALGGRNAYVEDVTFNPWTWQFDLKGLRIESANRPENHVLDLESLSTKVSFASVTQMAPIVEFIDVSGLHVQLTANEKNNEETAQKVEETSSASKSLPAFSLSNIRVANSSVRFTNPKAGATVNVTDINFELPVISTLPAASTGAIAPKLSLKVDGTPISATGTVKADAATMALNIADLDVAKILKAVPVTIPVDVRSAHLTTVLDLDFAMPKNGTTALTVKGTVQAKQVDVRADNGKTTAKVDNFSTQIDLFDLAKQTVNIKRIEIVKPAIVTTIASQSSNKAATTTATDTKASSSAAWNWSVSEAEIAGGSVKVTDSSLKPASSLSATAINLKANNFSSKNGATGTYSASAKVAGGTLDSTGKLTLTPLAVNATTNVKTLNFATFNPWIKTLAGAQLTKGTADVMGKLDYKSGKTMQVAWSGDFAVDNLEAKSAAGKTLMTWKEAQVTGMQLKSVDPVNITIKDLLIKEPAQQVTKTTSSVLGILGKLAEATGHSNTAQRLQKAEETITKDIHLQDVVYGNGRFSVNSKGTDTLQKLAIEALNNVFAKAQKK